MAGAVLVGAGVVTITQTRNRHFLPLAVTPLFFGIQQLLEGVVWLVLLERSSIPVELPALGFLFFAYLFWPIYAPWAVWCVEPNARRRRWIAGLSWLGLGVSLSLATALVTSGISPMITQQSIDYQAVIPASALSLTLYVIAACGGGFLSSHRPLMWISLLTLLSLLATRVFFYATLASVWCFFAAIISLAMAWFVIRFGRKSRSVGT